MEIKEILDSIFIVSFGKQIELAKTFIRFQEYFENSVFKGKIFTLEEFKKWYIKNSIKGKKTGKFTYYQDWDGFNIPSYALKPFYEGRFNPLTKYEKKLLAVFKNKKNKNFYIIGTSKEISIATLNHEISHGLFYINPEYRTQVLRVIRKINSQDKKKLKDFLLKYGGYHSAVLDDEIHAYLLDRRCLGKNGVSGKGLKIAGDKIKNFFKEFYT